uniref:Uncharacterized protein n=1 Tax=Romanomermis culicivorax TaxID=13658 RepID=A0A915KBK2_ROMCU
MPQSLYQRGGKDDGGNKDVGEGHKDEGREANCRSTKYPLNENYLVKISVCANGYTAKKHWSKIIRSKNQKQCDNLEKAHGSNGEL